MEITYGEHALQKIKVFHHLPSNKSTLLLIHGGAWNDANNTYDDFRELVSLLKDRDELAAHNIVGVNYRLSPDIVHPGHISDVVVAMKHIVEEFGVSLFLVLGHSVGATLALQLLNYRQILQVGAGDLTLGEHVEVEEVKIPDLDVSIRSLFLVDGIYDIPDLVNEYPSYLGFVNKAFTSERLFTEAVQPSWPLFTGLELSFDKCVVVQSVEDELLSLRQSGRLLDFLRGIPVEFEYHEESWGAHEEVYRREELADLVAKTLNEER